MLARLAAVVLFAVALVLVVIGGYDVDTVKALALGGLLALASAPFVDRLAASGP